MSTKGITKVKVSTYPKSRSSTAITHCSGCHYGMIIRIICECIDELDIQDRVILLGGVGCSYGWPMFYNTDASPCPHGRAPDMGTALKRLHPNSIVITCQGDGDLGAIGLGAFLNAIQRGEKMTTVLLNNAGYGTTGGQMAPTTLIGQVTTTSPRGRSVEGDGYPLHAAELVATLKPTAYSARVATNTPANYIKAKKAMKIALQKQIDGVGYSFVEFISACPPNWKMTPEECQAFIKDEMLKEYELGVFKDVDHIEPPRSIA